MHLCLLIKIPDLGCLYIWKEQGSLEQKQITRANWKVRRSSQKGIISWVHNLPRRGVLEPCLPVLTQQQNGRRLSSPESPPWRHCSVYSQAGPRVFVWLQREGLRESEWMPISKFEFLWPLWAPIFSTENERVGLNIPKGITQCWQYSVR